MESLPSDLRGTLVTAAELGHRHTVELRRHSFPIGVPSLDRALGSGLPRGVLVEITGHASSGRLSATLAALAAATASGIPAAFVDHGGSLDADSVIRLGIVPERLLWVLPRSVPDAARVAEELLAAGFPLVAMEAGLPPLPDRVPTATWLRLARLARDRGATLLLSSPYRLSGPAAGVVLRFHGVRGIWRGRFLRVLAGLESSVTVERHRGGAPAHGATHRWPLPDAVLADPAAAPPGTAVPEVLHAAG